MDDYLQEDTEMLLAPVIDRDTFSLSRSGAGYLAGEYPGGTTTVEGVPVAATVRILYRPESGQPGDGSVVAEVESAPDGTWRVDGLNPSLRYDVVGRMDGYNDVIVANVRPVVE